MLTENQLAEREGRIFSTDAAAALGVSKYRTPYQLWAEKIGLTQRDTEEKPWQMIGAAVEPAIASLYQQQTGVEVVPFKETLIHPRHPWMGSHFDFRAADRLVEIKFFDPRRRAEFGEPGSAAIPNDVLVQTIHEMVVAGIPHCDVAVLFGNQAFEVFTVKLDPADADELIEREYRFMGFVIEREPPPPMTDDDLKLMFPRSTESKVTASEEMLQAVREARMLGGRIDELTAAYDATVLTIKTFMGCNDQLVAPDGAPLATWRSAKDSRVTDWEAVAMKTAEKFDVCDEVSSGFVVEHTTTRPGSRRFLLKEEK